MKTFIPAVSAIAALTAMVDFCPAPPAAVLEPILMGVLGSTWGGVTGGVINKIHNESKRDFVKYTIRADDPFANLPQPAGNQCKEQLHGVTVKFSPSGKGAFRIDNVPSSCMTLSNVILGDGTDPNQPRPTPLGSDALSYNGVSDDDLNRLQAIFDGN
ncbi:hypothetical protein ASPWEDRAFT_181894 [Aspergillus wentii DTO 134E9]|uniref:Uncharacterized protein n=1 Tax=Aspergillus wentii DTO 134E9 TaxID=1073089 RepID=A0A1L9RQ50_ASPWE|nr:uncharacterized protein ASPWEDRAFT_181894 [Aspergillus wentii DTO 134E9]KAI9923917.1 hypothetical protein MW887_008222 [Aspergillus wentii]OJJ36948.1 hypothetical protein ASPWEDRAFT_181894 [Aspergillus wentii DTO 134E9]